MRISAFNKILEEMVSRLSGALGAIFIDWQGEAVDEFSCIGDTNIRIVGAYWGIAYYQAFNLYKKFKLSSPQEVILRFQDQQVIIRRVTDEYLVVLTLRPDANLGRAIRALDQAEVLIREEM